MDAGENDQHVAVFYGQVWSRQNAWRQHGWRLLEQTDDVDCSTQPVLG